MSDSPPAKRSWLPMALTLVALLLIAPLAVLPFFGERWLVAAVVRGNARTTRLLLYFNPNWAKAELIPGKESILGFAVNKKNLKMIRFLLQRGAKPINSREVEAIIKLILKDEIVLTYFLNSGLNPNDIIDDKNNSLLYHFIILEPDNQRIKLLLQAGANPNMADGLGKTALHHAWDADKLALLAKAGASPHIPDFEGETPLFRAAYWGNEIKIAFLLQAGADPLWKNKKGQTPLDVAQGEKAQALLRQAIAERAATQAQQEAQP
jgi:ankyrin repeat protein